MTKCDLCKYYNQWSERACKKIGKDCEEAIKNLIKYNTDKNVTVTYVNKPEENKNDDKKSSRIRLNEEK